MTAILQIINLKGYEYAKEEEKNKATDWSTLQRILLRKSGEYLLSI